MDIIHLDIKSMMLMCVFIGFLISGGLAALLRDRYVCPGMPYWVIGFCFFTLGIFFAVYRAYAPLWVSVFFGNAFSFIGTNLLWLGLLQYNQRLKSVHYSILAFSLLIALLLLFMLHTGVPEIKRAELISFVFNVQSILCIREALKDRAQYESGRLMFALTCILATAGSLLRFLTYQYESSYSLLNTNISNLLLVFNAIIVLLGLSFSIMLITSQWLQQKLAAFASYDALTGIYNRYGLNEQSTALFNSDGKLSATDYSVAMIDIDFFKKTNDDYGHPVGDAVLKEVADRLRQNIRHHDILARYGGEEFIVVLPGTNITDALHWAERVRAQVAAKPIQVDQHAIQITLSIGVVALPGKDKHSAFDEAIRQADIALYQAKENGRNQVRCFGAVV
ncbi:GGDEF domain-containing protein [Tolumonas auensis]|uniref:GGDEF domain-containing protein n=1 Tax=Tolumonas auensis TaxID=43948 RepID=UPI002AA747A3|nr:GGDEF domain-containing protein [Tolumonas auensis]